MHIGFIGLGNMGGPMALNLIKAGHTLVVYDVRRETANPHLDAGATWADGPKEVARAGEQILIEAMARGWGDRDSTSPWELQEEAARVKVRSST